ncbi:hypothetical protein U1Q18_000983 [Sarracenia purpurea var. burkii]
MRRQVESTWKGTTHYRWDNFRPHSPENEGQNSPTSQRSPESPRGSSPVACDWPDQRNQSRQLITATKGGFGGDTSEISGSNDKADHCKRDTRSIDNHTCSVNQKSRQLISATKDGFCGDTGEIRGSNDKSDHGKRDVRSTEDHTCSTNQKPPESKGFRGSTAMEGGECGYTPGNHGSTGKINSCNQDLRVNYDDSARLEEEMEIESALIENPSRLKSYAGNGGGKSSSLWKMENSGIIETGSGSFEPNQTELENPGPLDPNKKR